MAYLGGAARTLGQAWAVTALLAAATAVGVPAGVALAGGSVTVAGALPLAQILAALVLLRTRWPVRTLLASIATVAAYRSAGLVDTGWVWPATVAFAGVVLAGRAGWATLIGAAFLTYAASWESTVGGHTPEWVAGQLGGETLWLAVVVAGTMAYRNRRRWRDEVAARLRQSQHERELQAGRRRAEERVRIARELHDVVAHTLAVVGVHLNVALDTVDSAPGEARDALRLAQDVRGRAMTDLKAMIGVLRDDTTAGVDSPMAQLDGLAALIDQVRMTGLAVTLDEAGDRSHVPTPVALAAYRVVQEALTNTVRHARASRVVVTLRYAPAQLTVAVTDDGSARSTDGGHGIAGMRERVEALGGSLAAGPADHGGFLVRAVLPVVC
ncbi:Signal transduction histidine kinase [Micromonospora phaseoli]|uniref:histidine kinase n=2 Tax=Micromonospora phaseoli TaxID=1144548 RepID=A0A1H6V4B7_9ACTN|nr:signal transduction histidine kinase [Micromonospora phaseoli]GIJ78667.1 ATPase [Micromonospora phaseoli]SEI95132.1 Signal transduction histidine kinase [Micromonospora phaseoli]